MESDVPWDKNAAIDQIARATISGDYEAARLGWLRLTEANVNAAYGQFARQLIPVITDLHTALGRLAVMAEGLAALDKRTDRRAEPREGQDQGATDGER